MNVPSCSHGTASQWPCTKYGAVPLKQWFELSAAVRQILKWTWMHPNTYSRAEIFQQIRGHVAEGLMAIGAKWQGACDGSHFQAERDIRLWIEGQCVTLEQSAVRFIQYECMYGQCAVLSGATFLPHLMRVRQWEAARMLRGILEEVEKLVHVLVPSSSGTGSETLATNVPSPADCCLTIVVKMFTPPDVQGGAIKHSKEYTGMPDFADIHEQAEALLREQLQTVSEFRLWLDDRALSNANTLSTLGELQKHGTKRILIFAKFTSGHPAHDVGSQSRSPPTSRSEEHESHVCSRRREGVLIYVDGNIGSKKSELMQLLAQINPTTGANAPIVREHLQEWEPLLEKFYAALRDPSAPESVEDTANLERHVFRHHREIATSSSYHARDVIAERGPHSKVRVFNRVLRDRKLLAEGPYQEMLSEYNELKKDPANLPAAVILTETSVDRAMEQIRERGRRYEMHITPDYLEALDQRLKELYPDDDPTVVRVDSNQPVEDIVNDVLQKLPGVLRSQGVSEQRIEHIKNLFSDHRSHGDSVSSMA